VTRGTRLAETSHMPRFLPFVLMPLVCVLGVARADAQTPDLRDMTLEDLLKIEVTSASRQDERAEDVAAAVYVISRDEIRRSGLTTLPDLLRLAPGVQVAQINSNKWAVSVRGFNSLYANKLLVMIDGRSIYNPAYSSVLWDTEDLLIEDIDRIEVIRGPGGAMWGANAVNGVINIITRPSTVTQGGFAQAGAGNVDRASGSARYGGTVGSLTYRAFVQAASHGDSTTPGGSPITSDRWRTVTSGFRADWSRGRDALMLQGATTGGRQRPLWYSLDPVMLASGQLGLDAVSQTGNANAVVRWTRTQGNGAFQIQGYFDHSHRDEIIGAYRRQTADVDAQYHRTIAKRHTVVAGGGYRYIVEEVDGRSGYIFAPGVARPVITNVFAQDAVSLAGGRVELIGGAKYERNTFAGSGFQPTFRAMWKPTSHQRVWSAVSRAIRIPSMVDRGIHVEYPPIVQPNGVVLFGGLTGNPEFSSEHLVNTEVGYRVSVGARATIDLVSFVGRYDDLQTFEPLDPVLVPTPGGPPQLRVLTRNENRMTADTRGVELSGRLQVTSHWQVDGAFSSFHFTPHGKGSRDPRTMTYDGRAPRFQWRVHSSFPLGPRAHGDVHLFHVGGLDEVHVPAYMRLDLRAEWPLTTQLSTIVSGQNLLQDSHPEFAGHESNTQSMLVRRGGSVKLAWRF
jgi:iron complex outermembrane recepter protein